MFHHGVQWANGEISCRSGKLRGFGVRGLAAILALPGLPKQIETPCGGSRWPLNIAEVYEAQWALPADGWSVGSQWTKAPCHERDRVCLVISLP